MAEFLYKKRRALYTKYVYANNMQTVWLNPIVHHVCMLKSEKPLLDEAKENRK